MLCHRQELICWNLSFGATFPCSESFPSSVTLLCGRTGRKRCCHVGIFLCFVWPWCQLLCWVPRCDFVYPSVQHYIYRNADRASLWMQWERGTASEYLRDKDFLQSSHSWPAGVSLETELWLTGAARVQGDRSGGFRSNICPSVMWLDPWWWTMWSHHWTSVTEVN